MRTGACRGASGFRREPAPCTASGRESGRDSGRQDQQISKTRAPGRPESRMGRVGERMCLVTDGKGPGQALQAGPTFPCRGRWPRGVWHLQGRSPCRPLTVSTGEGRVGRGRPGLYLDARTAALAHGVRHGSPGRVDHGHEPHEAELLRGEVQLVRVKLEAPRKLPRGQIQLTKP